MYLPAQFEETRVDELHRFIEAHPLGALVARGPHGLDANHLPFLLDPVPDGQSRLLAHVARANPLWRELADRAEVLVIFRTDGAYISPNWYPSKHEMHRQVPTWNYQAVHVHGTITVRDDAKFVRGVVGRLTHAHEGRVEPNRPWKMSDSPANFVEQMVASIVGIEIGIDRMVGKWKLGQNKDDRDRLSAAEALRARGDEHTSRAMRDAPQRKRED